MSLQTFTLYRALHHLPQFKNDVITLNPEIITSLLCMEGITMTSLYLQAVSRRVHQDPIWELLCEEFSEERAIARNPGEPAQCKEKVSFDLYIKAVKSGHLINQDTSLIRTPH